MTGPRVLYVQYTNPAAYPPLEHSARLLANAGAEVLLLGTAIPGTHLSFATHDRITLKLFSSSEPGWRQKLHYARFAGWIIGQAREWRPDWIYASDALSCPVALVLAASCGERLVYHEHDSPADAPVTRSFFMSMVLAARRRVAHRADYCVLPNERRLEAFRRVHPGARGVTVWNCPLREEVRNQERSEADGRMRVLYHGSIVPARLPLTIIDALATLPDGVTLVVAGYETAGFPGYVDALRRRAGELGIGTRVEFAGTISRREDLLSQCAQCDVGLALMPLVSPDLNEREMVGASNKPFDYMACGLALIVSDLSAWRETFVDPGYALACNPESPASVAAALRRLLEGPSLRRDMGEQGRQRILGDWHYERAFAPVLAALNANLATTTRHVNIDNPAAARVQHVNRVSE